MSSGCCCCHYQRFPKCYEKQKRFIHIMLVIFMMLMPSFYLFIQLGISPLFTSGICSSSSTIFFFRCCCCFYIVWFSSRIQCTIRFFLFLSLSWSVYCLLFHSIHLVYYFLMMKLAAVGHSDVSKTMSTELCTHTHTHINTRIFKRTFSKQQCINRNVHFYLSQNVYFDYRFNL